MHYRYAIKKIHVVIISFTSMQSKEYVEISERCLKDLDSLVITILNCDPSLDPVILRNSVYASFAQKLNPEHCSDCPGSEGRQRLQELVLNQMESHKELVKWQQPKRGRPLKFKQAEKELVMWIKSENRTQFSKKEIDNHFKKLTGYQRSLSNYSLHRILTTYGVAETVSITRQDKRPSQRPLKPLRRARMNEKSVEKEAQMAVKNQQENIEQQQENGIANNLHEQYSESSLGNFMIWEDREEGINNLVSPLSMFDLYEYE